jgi:apolipoprotein N-acyltransferase
MRLELFGVVILVVFTVFVTAFAAAADKKAVRALPKALWVLLCLLVSPIGGILYLTLGRPLPSETQNTDDPSYLRRLADRLRENNNDN